MDRAQPLRRLPYPGLDPFGFAHQDLFFGRDTEGRTVAAMLAAEPLSVLTGASGTGKSSLIRASIMPTLLKRGWCTVYAHPAANPIEALRQELLAQAIPDPEREIALIDRLLQANDAAQTLRNSSPISHARSWYESLQPDDPLRTDIFGDTEEKIARIPMLALVVAGIVPPDRAVRCFASLAADAEKPIDPTLDEVRKLLERAADGRRRLVDKVSVAQPSLAKLTSRVWRYWLLPQTYRGLMLILDQGEELYTAFGATHLGRGGVQSPAQPRSANPKVSLRDRLFEELPELVAEARRHPLRFCFSLRPEWYTDLRVSLGHSMPDESRAVHILTPLSRAQAGGAIEKPAALVKANAENEARDIMLDALEKEGEGRGLDPFLLGLLNRIAWDFALAEAASGPVSIGIHQLRKIAAGPEPEPNKPWHTAPRKVIVPSLVAGSLLWLLHMFLDGLEGPERFDAVDILDSLFTIGGTRRIVPEREIVERPLRPAEALRALLVKMEAARLVRRIPRGTETFVEIRHDRLAQPLLAHKAKLLEQEQHDAGSMGRYRNLLGRAIDVLMRSDGKRVAQSIADGLRNDVLPAWARECLRFNRDAIAWDPPAARMTFASLLHEGPSRLGELDWHEYRGALRRLMAEASAPPRIDGDPNRLDALQLALQRGLQVSMHDLAGVGAADIARFPIDTRMLLLDSLLRHTTAANAKTGSEEVKRWTRACLGHP